MCFFAADCVACFCFDRNLQQAYIIPQMQTRRKKNKTSTIIVKAATYSYKALQ